MVWKYYIGNDEEKTWQKQICKMKCSGLMR